MKRLLIWCLLSVAALAQPRYLAVLCYHQINDRADTEMVTTPKRFREQLDFLQQQGYQTVDLAEARAFVDGKSKVAKPVLITFDDGYDGVYRYALPQLKKRKMQAVVFLVVSQVDRMKPTAHLTQAQLREMADCGVFEFGSHTYDMHIPIPERRDAGAVSSAAIRRDLIRSREVLQGWLKRPVRALAWPYGHYDETCLKLAQQSGFQLVFTTDYGYNLPGCGPWRIRRIRLSSVFDTVEVLRAKLATGG